MAKATAFWQVAYYREAYGLFAFSSIMASHESPMRPERFVTQKIIQGVKGIAAGSKEKLKIGSLYIWRDWGWAPDYVEAMYLMLQAEKAEDYVIATGTPHWLGQFADAAFAAFGLATQDWLEVTSSLMRTSDLQYSGMDSSKIHNQLGWKSGLGLEKIVRKMNDQSVMQRVA